MISAEAQVKRFFNKNGIWILFIAVIAAVTLCVVNYFSVNASPLDDLVNTVLTPVRSGISSVHDWLEDKKAYYEEHETLAEENRELKNRVAELEAELRQAETDSEENERLRTLLELRQQHRDYTLESAKIISRSANNWERSLTLSCGSAAGIECGDCVITEARQLVGIVEECGESWCKVLTVIDTGISIGATVFRTGEICVAVGDFQQMDKGYLSAQYVDSNTDIMVGDLVVTSGLGGYYPSGLTIGSVVNLQLDASGLAMTATLKPAADLDALTQVFVIKDFSVTE